MPKYAVDAREKCLKCFTIVKFIRSENNVEKITVAGKGELVQFFFAQCPHCGHIIVTAVHLENRGGPDGLVPKSEQIIMPLSSGKLPAPLEVPIDIAQDFNEASICLPFSRKASAALSRRCLQALLRDAAKTKSKDLSDQIDEVLTQLPSYISKNLDAVRNIGNFAAHQIKSKNSGAILDVELGEAEWNLEVLETLFDFYYVKPVFEQQKRDSLNSKLQAAGKPPLKN